MTDRLNYQFLAFVSSFSSCIQFSGYIRRKSFSATGIHHAPLAQLVEQLTLNQWVRGSSPRRCTKGAQKGGDSESAPVSVFNAEGPPVPIPNTVVKLCGADNTRRATAREDRSLLTLSFRFYLIRIYLRLDSSVGRATDC